MHASEVVARNKRRRIFASFLFQVYYNTYYLLFDLSILFLIQRRAVYK
jgi:hypothetical protein